MSIDRILETLPSKQPEPGGNNGKHNLNGAKASTEGNQLIEALKKAGLYLSADRHEPDKHHVTCPWSDEHGGETRRVSSYFRDGSSPNYQWPFFKCSHAHSRHPEGAKVYKTKDLRAWLMQHGHLSEEKLIEPGEPGELKGIDRLAHEWAKKMHGRFLAVEGNQWFKYSNGFWQSVPVETVEVDAHQFLRDRSVSVTPKVRRDLVTLARTDLCVMQASELNSDLSLIPLANGVYNVSTGDLVEHSPGLMLTGQRSYPYDESATCPRFEQFLREVLITEEGEPCEEWIRVIEEWMGYCLTADNREQTALLIVGQGSNGKGVFTWILSQLVGEDQVASISLRQLPREFHRASLLGKFVGFIDEPSKDDMRLAGDWFKKITGNDLIAARNPYGSEFRFRPFVRFVISCNALPSTNDHTFGYFRRPIIIEWRRRFGEPEPWGCNASLKPLDPNLREKLTVELPGIFNLAISGLRRFRANGNHFSSSLESKLLKSEYALSQDTVSQFLQERMGRHPDRCVEVDALYHAYKGWAEESGYRNDDVLNKWLFGKRLNELGYPKSRQKRDSDKKIRVRDGLYFVERQEPKHDFGERKISDEGKE